MRLSFNNQNPLFEFDIYREDGILKIFISVFRYSKILDTGIKSESGEGK